MDYKEYKRRARLNKQYTFNKIKTRYKLQNFLNKIFNNDRNTSSK